MRKGGEERRKLPRFRIGSVGGSVTTPVEAEFVNLSMEGALVDHPGTLRVGSECILTLPAPDAAVSIRCLVAHSTVDHRATESAGEGLLICRTGLRFLDLSPEAENLLATLIRSHGEGGKGG